MSLIFGYNGLSRVFNRGLGGGARAAQAPMDPGAFPAPQAGLGPGASGFGREAVGACTGLTEGAACSFSMDGRTITGTCARLSGGELLVCVPQGRPAPAFRPGTLPTGAPPQANRGNVPFSNETGYPGVFRFFTAPLSRQMSWLRPSRWSAWSFR